MSFPQLYGSGQWNLDLNPKTFLKWILNAFGHAVIVFYFCYTFKGQVSLALLFCWILHVL
jgi:hypothetical protein